MVETQTVDASNVTSSIALSTTLVSTDLIFVAMTKGSSGTNTITINGSAPTAVGNWQQGIGSTRLYVYTKTGLTGSHSVSYTNGAACHFTVIVVRGLTSPSTISTSVSTWDSTTTASNVEEGPTGIAAASGQIAIAVGACNTGTITFPSSPVPATWTNDRVDASGVGNGCVSHAIPTSSVTAYAGIKTSAGPTQIAVALFVAG